MTSADCKAIRTKLVLPDPNQAEQNLQMDSGRRQGRRSDYALITHVAKSSKEATRTNKIHLLAHSLTMFNNTTCPTPPLSNPTVRPIKANIYPYQWNN